jgi:hypothetical protein
MRLAALTGVLLSLVVAAPAGAATVSATTGGSGAFGIPSGSVIFDAAPGEANRVTMRLIAGTRGVVEVREEGAALTTGARCTLVSPGVAHCDTAADFTDAMVNLGDGDDTITIEDPLFGNVDAGSGDDTVTGACIAVGGDGADHLSGCANTATAFSHRYLGGRGDDTIEGGPAPDTIDGGGGRDTLRGGDGDDNIHDGDGARGEPAPDFVDGGQGSDTVVYSARIDPVHVDLAQGTGGEGDVLQGVENVWGGVGDDVLLGNEDANRLDAGPGRDTIDGRGGADRLLGGAGVDRITGGDGDDYIVARDVYRDSIDCDAGADQLLSDRGDQVAPGCEAVTNAYRLVSFPRLGAANRRVSFRVRCMETDELAREQAREFEPCALRVALRFRIRGRLTTVATGKCSLQRCTTLRLRRDAWKELLARRRVAARVEFTRVPGAGTLRHVDLVTLKLHESDMRAARLR